MYLRIEASEKHLYWVAELALLAQLPPHWKEYKVTSPSTPLNPQP